jgi:hypothetical protein
MKFSKRQLRRIIKESLLVEAEMLNIMKNQYEDLDQFNRIANYAINNDIQGALNDPELPTEDLYWILDDMSGWVDKVGDDSERWFSPGTVVPPNWDLANVNDFMDELESAAETKVGQDEVVKDAAAPNKPERDALASAFTMSVILPGDIQHITYQIRRKGGEPNWIMLTDDDGSLGHMSTGIGKDDYELKGTSLEKIIKVLEDGGATLRKKQKSSPPMMPYYD